MVAACEDAVHVLGADVDDVMERRARLFVIQASIEKKKVRLLMLLVVLTIVHACRSPKRRYHPYVRALNCGSSPQL